MANRQGDVASLRPQLALWLDWLGLAWFGLVVQLYSWAVGSSEPWECNCPLATRFVNPSGEICYVMINMLAFVILHDNLIVFCFIILPSVACLEYRISSHYLITRKNL